ncbi:MAG: phytanoyl-CoA dioxygenase family protein [Verrucomicrobiales bacterium]|nr:phytanoyl-CoA dioxygenase family protein [Verrucomicrobiales bacterium]
MYISIEEFDRVCKQVVSLDDYPCAVAIEYNVVIYSGDQLRERMGDGASEIKAEFAACLKDGPGVFAISGAYADTSVIAKTTDLFLSIIGDERAAGVGKGDHFGANERIWNSKQKACERDPELFVDYYSNPLLALACQAWLGPFYQVAAQVNNVKPGSQAQSVHRDYHLGFQSADDVGRFPAHAQVMSQYLTLQGAIAHGDMPLESGPTHLLPFSQRYEPGYLAYRRPEFAAYFDRHKVQVPLKNGDMLFFNPALFHGAGTNAGDCDRLANLLQISSAFGRSMESLDTHAMISAVYSALKDRQAEGTVTPDDVDNIIVAVADGYAFPTNLDSDPPIGGNAPETDQQLMRQALGAEWSLDRLMEALAARAERRRP